VKLVYWKHLDTSSCHTTSVVFRDEELGDEGFACVRNQIVAAYAKIEPIND